MKFPNIEKLSLNQVLIIVAAFLVFIIISTTIIVKKRPVPQTVVVARGENKIEGKVQNEFRKLGTLRTKTKAEHKNENGVTVVIRPILSYDSGDRDFFEELSRKNPAIKNIFTTYFSEKTKAELKSIGEEKIKADLRDEINSKLTLNKIREIYFEDLNYMD